MNALIYCMGDGDDDVLRGLQLSDADQGQCANGKVSLLSFFVVKKNIVHDRAHFNMSKQEANETVDGFVPALYALAEPCNYGTLHDEFIRDWIVLGPADTRLSECMQMRKDLDLNKSIIMARQSEEIKTR